MSVEEILKARIKESGPISVAQFMGLVLGHPEYGYYNTRDPFGQGGDFTTAPEISQLFGEMIGVWVVDTWQKLGSPSGFVFLECGPGRGTLTADAMRASKGVPGFHEAVQITLMEMSPVLRDAQKKTLGGFDVSWISNLEELEAAVPVIVIGNEFWMRCRWSSLSMAPSGWLILMRSRVLF